MVHSKGQSGLVFSRMPSGMRKERLGQERIEIYEPVYFGHYESIGSPTGSKRFTWLMGDPDMRRSIQSFDNAVYLSKKTKIKVKKKKIGRFDSFGSLLSMGSLSTLSMRNSGRGSSLYEKMLRKVGSFDGLVRRYDGIRFRSKSHESKDKTLQRHDALRFRSKSHTLNMERGIVQMNTVGSPAYEITPKRNFIIQTHLVDDINASDHENEMLETITEDPNSPYVTQTSLSQYCNQINKIPSVSGKVSLMEVFKENEFTKDVNKKLDTKIEGDKHYVNVEDFKPTEDTSSSTINDQNSMYSRIRFKNGKEEKKKKGTSAEAGDHEINYTALKFGTVYV